MSLWTRTAEPSHDHPLWAQLLPGLQEGLPQGVHAMLREVEDRGSLP